MKLSGSDLKVKAVPESNPRYLEYELDLKNQEEINTYKGDGHLVAKMQTGKECRFDIEWQMVVVQRDRIVGAATNISANSETCAVEERNMARLDLKRVE